MLRKLTNRKGALFAILCSLLLCSCWEDQQRAVAQCDIEAERIYPEVHTGPSNNMDTIEHYMKKCMRARGYDWHWGNDRCEPTLSSSENPYCYVPTDQIGLAIFKWEMKQQGVGVR
jgi:hypothetical protein